MNIPYHPTTPVTIRTVFIEAKNTVEGSKVYPRLFEKLTTMNDLLDMQAAKHKRKSA